MVYFIQNHQNQFIKIGKAGDPRRRLLSLQTSIPHKLKLLAVIPGDRQEEVAIQHRFHEDRIDGEWFHTTPKLVSFAIRSEAATAARRPDKASPFMRLALIGPRLLDLLQQAASVVDDNTTRSFCANAVWYGYNGWGGIKPQLLDLVGFEVRSRRYPELRTMEAYSTAYQTIYKTLPDCRHCLCE